MTRINLLPDSFIEHRRLAAQRRLAVALGCVLSLAGAVWAGAALAQLRQMSAKVAAAETALAEVRARGEQLDRQQRRHAAVTALLDRGSHLDPPVPATALIALLTRHLPDTLVLQRLSVQAPAPEIGEASPAPGRADPGRKTQAAEGSLIRVGIEGVAMSDADVAQLVSALSREKLFADVKLARSRHVTVGTLPRFAFQISFAVRATTPARAEASERGRAHGA